MSLDIRLLRHTFGIGLAMAVTACGSAPVTAPSGDPAASAKGRATSIFTVSVSRAGTGTGTVTSSPAGINCGPTSTTCSATFASGTVVTLSATPDIQSEFGSWGGGCSGATPSCSVTLSANLSTTATFALVAADSYNLVLDLAGNGQGGVSIIGSAVYSCTVDCIVTEKAGSTVTLTATPVEGSVFGGWGGACSGTATTCSVTLNGPLSVSATFSIPTVASHVSIPAAYRNWTRRDWSVDIDVAAHAMDPTLLPGAVVTVQLSGGLTATRTCTVTSAGTCLIPSGSISSKANSITFTITNVSLAGYAYDPSLNHNLNPANLGATASATVTSNNAVTFYR